MIQGELAEPGMRKMKKPKGENERASRQTPKCHLRRLRKRKKKEGTGNLGPIAEERRGRRKLSQTHRIPEPEPPQHLRLWIPHAHKRIIAEIQSLLLGRRHILRIPIHHLAAIQIEQTIQIHFRQDPIPRVHIRLKRQRQRDVQEIVPSTSGVMLQEGVERRQFDQGAKRARE